MLVTMWCWRSKQQFLPHLRTFQGTDVERSDFCVYCCCLVLLPCCSDWIQDVWEQRCWQYPYHTGETPLAYSSSRPVCCHPCYWKPPGAIPNLLQIICFYIYFIESSFPRKLVETADICYASVWHARNIIGEETPFHTLFQASSYYTHSICWWVLHALLSIWDLTKSFSQCSWLLIFLIYLPWL